MIRRLVLLLASTLLLVASAAPPALAGNPVGGVPPLRADGPVTLPDGRVLPVRPSWARESSPQAEMLAAHAHDAVTFTPGTQPRPRSATTTTLALAPVGEPGSALLALAGASGPAASLTAAAASVPNGMRKEVLGFLPYWLLDAGSLQSMQYQLVTTIAYFGVAARADGTLAMLSGSSPTPGWSGWNSSAMTSVINAAHARGVRVVLTVTMMAWDSASAAGQAQLLGNAAARAALVSAIAATVRDRAADGVNLDFEPIATPLRDQYTSFVRQLKAGLVAAGVGSYLTVDATGGAATWASGYDIGGLTAAGAADAIFVMGYDYSWSGSARAGAVAPMDSPYILDVNESVDDYLSMAPASRLIWGVPYYGRTWQTTSGDPNAPTRPGGSGASKSYTYNGARSLAATYGRRWDDVGKVPWFVYYDTAAATWVEGYYDDASSLAAKYDMVNQKGLAGTGMWTLLMDQGDGALWSLLAAKFANDTTPPIGGIRVLPAVSDAAALQVAWAATDVGSGVRSYTVQARERPGGAWLTWMAGTAATGGTYVGVPGRTYEFRVSASDYKGNAQPWAASAPDPAPAVAVGGFATVAVDALNVRSGAATSFDAIDTLPNGSLVAVLAGPVSAGGYPWYQVQFGFSEWPSASYPRVGWVAAASGATSYLASAPAPNLTTISPSAPPITPVTDLVVPVVTVRSPAPGAVNVSLDAPLGATLSEPVHGVSTGSMVLSRLADLVPLPATATYDQATMAATLRTTSRLLPGTTYRLAMSGSIKDAAGNPLPWTWWTFTTVSSEAYSPARTLLFAAGTYTGYRFSSTGAILATKRITLAAGSSALTVRYAAISGQAGGWYAMSSGAWAGYWIRGGPGITLR